MTEKEIKIANVGPPKEIVYENTRIIAPKMAVIEKKKDSTRIDLDGKLKITPPTEIICILQIIVFKLHFKIQLLPILHISKHYSKHSNPFYIKSKLSITHELSQ